MSTEIPETVDAADVTSWSDEVDVVVIGLGVLALGPVAQRTAAASGPFADFVGSWSGTGTISLANGSSERIRCQAAYAPGAAAAIAVQGYHLLKPGSRFEIVWQDGSARPRAVTSPRWKELTRLASSAASAARSSTSRSRDADWTALRYSPCALRTTPIWELKAPPRTVMVAPGRRPPTSSRARARSGVSRATHNGLASVLADRISMSAGL